MYTNKAYRSLSVNDNDLYCDYNPHQPLLMRIVRVHALTDLHNPHPGGLISSSLLHCTIKFSHKNYEWHITHRIEILVGTHTTRAS